MQSCVRDKQLFAYIMDREDMIPNQLNVTDSVSKSSCTVSVYVGRNSTEEQVSNNSEQYGDTEIKQEDATADGDTHDWAVKDFKVETVTVEVEPYNIVENIGETSTSVDPLLNKETEGTSGAERNDSAESKTPNLHAIFERSVQGRLRKHFIEYPFQSPNFSVQDYLKKHSPNYPGTYMKDNSKKLGSTQAGGAFQSVEKDGVKVFKCEICEKTFKKRDHLKRHFITHSAEKPFKCDTCQRTFTDKSNLKKHFRSHTGEMRFKCEVCLRTFRDAGNLKIHTLTHTGEKPFQCHICPRNFTQSFSLVKHIRTHTGEKPFKCEICDTTFRNMCHLKRHSRIHTGEKPYKCEKCERTFTRKYNLMAHNRSHDHSADNPDQMDRSYDFNPENPLNVDHSQDHNAENPVKLEN